MFQDSQPLLVDIKDLIYVFLKKIIYIVLFGLLFSGLIFGYKLYKILNESKANDYSNVVSLFDVSSKLPEETDIEYSERVLNVNRANDLVSSVNVIKRQIDNHRKYVAESVFMTINAENEAITSVNLVVTVDQSNSTNINMALLSSYKQYIQSGEYLSGLSDDLGIDQGYITELISVDYNASSISINNISDNGSSGVMSIKVIGPTTEFTEKVMSSILENISVKQNELVKSVTPHNVVVASLQSSYIVDSSTRDRQVSAINRFESLEQQIINFDKILDTVSSNLGVSKESIYSFYSSDDNNYNNEFSVSYKSAVLYAAIGFVLGAMFVMAFYTINYIFGKKFTTQGKFFCKFNTVRKLGVINPKNKRTRFVKFVEEKSGDDSSLSKESNYKLLSANIKNITKDMNKILFTGTTDTDSITELVKQLGIKADVKTSFFKDPSSLDSLRDYDGVIIVESRSFSECKYVAEEIELIKNSHIDLVGAVIL